MSTLRELPKKIDELGLQIVQLRAEMRDEFSAMRGEMHAGDEETRRSLREEIRAGDEETRRLLREEIEGTRRQMRVLHEDIIGRLALLQEGRSRTRRRKKP